MRIAIVIMTILEPTPAILKYANIDECDLIIVADKRTPVEKYMNIKCILLSLDKQLKLFPKFHRLLPSNHHGRKNMGYAYAIKNNYDIIVDTSDDVIPDDNWKTLLTKKYSKYIMTGSKFVNVYTMFSSFNVWPRGYPLDKIRSKNVAKVTHTKGDDIGVIQGLIDNEPDVDSIFKMVSDQYTANFKFKNNNNMYILSNDSYCPSNGFNTYWISKDMFYLLYTPCNVSYKFSDILKMYIAQTFMKRHNKKMAYVSPNVFRVRMQDEPFSYFPQEIEMFTSVNKTIQILDKTHEHKYDLQKIYQMLVDDGVVYDHVISGSKESKLLKEWFRLLNGSVYEELFDDSDEELVIQIDNNVIEQTDEYSSPLNIDIGTEPIFVPLSPTIVNAIKSGAPQILMPTPIVAQKIEEQVIKEEHMITPVQKIEEEQSYAPDNVSIINGVQTFKPHPQKMNKSKNPLNVTICFYGLTRSLKYTYFDIKKNIIDVIIKAGHTVNVICHTYKTICLNNNKSGEKGVNLDNDEYMMLKSDHVDITNDAALKSSPEMFEFMKQVISKYDEKQYIYNFFCLLHSKQQLFKIIKDKALQSDVYIILRPDLIYLNEFNINELNECALKRNVMLPSWDTNNGYNNKIAMLYKDHVEKYLNLIGYIKFINDSKTVLSSEGFLQLILTKMNTKVGEFSLIGKRMRGNKNIIDNEYDQQLFSKNFIYLVLTDDNTNLSLVKKVLDENEQRDMFIGQMPFEMQLEILAESERKYKYYVFVEANIIDQSVDLTKIENELLADNLSVAHNKIKQYQSSDGIVIPTLQIDYDITYLKYNVMTDYL